MVIYLVKGWDMTINILILIIFIILSLLVIFGCLIFYLIAKLEESRMKIDFLHNKFHLE